MKGKNIILFGSGTFVGFASCGALISKKILKNEKMREALKQVISDKVYWFMWGDDRIESSRYRTRPYRINYQSYYDYSRRYRTESMNAYKDIVFESMNDALVVLDSMSDIITTYGFVTVADLCDLSDVGCDYLSNLYGWTCIKDCEPVRVKGGYSLDLPEPKRISYDFKKGERV